MEASISSLSFRLHFDPNVINVIVTTCDSDLTLSCCLFPGLNRVTVKPGDDVELECLSPRPGVVSLVEWSRADLESEGYVFFYRDERTYRKFQHPSFLDRVKLRDPAMKGGDVSVVVKHVTVNDTGTYDCYVSTIGSSRNQRKRRESPGISRTIQLLVQDEPGQSRCWVIKNTKNNRIICYGGVGSQICRSSDMNHFVIRDYFNQNNT